VRVYKDGIVKAIVEGGDGYGWYLSRWQYEQLHGLVKEDKGEVNMDDITWSAERVKELLGIEVEGKPLETAFVLFAERIAALEKMVVMNMHEECGSHDVFRVHSDLVLDEDVVAVIQNVKSKMSNKKES